jgi:serine/threonine protein kinase
MTSEKRVLQDRYRLLSELGKGGMGSVWLAQDQLLDRKVALKQLALEISPTDVAERRTRALQEAKALARVDHPAIVDIYDVFIADANPCIVMKYIRGPSLGEIIQERASLAEQELGEQQIARIGLPVLNALVAVHAASVVHRDVKPANIVVARDGLVYLVDFGIAKIIGEQSLTSRSKMLGTPEFFAPEQIEGPKVGPAADLWSLGVTLFYALEGYSPFRRRGDQEAGATLLAIVRDEPPRPRRQGPLADVILQLLRKEPSQRPTAAQVASVLESLADKSPSSGRWRPPPTVNAFPHPGPDGHPRPRAGAQGAAKPHSPAPTKAEVNRLLSMPEREAAALLASYQPATAGPLLHSMAAARPQTAASVLQMLSSSQAAHAVDHLNPDIAASLLVAMPLSDAARILNRASVRTAAGVIMDLPGGASAELVKAMRSERLAKVLEYVRPVIVADLVERAGESSSTLLEQLSEPSREQVLRHLSRGRRVRRDPV